jgi:hypothetical protein
MLDMRAIDAANDGTEVGPERHGIDGTNGGYLDD